jgi:hypothetical protein
MEVGRDEHESEIGLGGHHAEDKKLGIWGGSNLAYQLGEGRLGGDARGFIKEIPLAVLHTEEEVDDVTAFGW